MRRLNAICVSLYHDLPLGFAKMKVVAKLGPEMFPGKIVEYSIAIG